MPSAHEIAADVLHVFGSNVVDRKPPMTYGHYAKAIGRDPSEYGIAVGKAMHAIGAYCVLKELPVAPLYWVQKGDGGHRGVFESDPLERHYILDSGDIDTMYVVSREYQYTSEEFAGLEKAVRKSLASNSLTVTDWSPHKIWHETFRNYVKDSSLTYYQRAMARYRDLLSQIKKQRRPHR